MDSKFGIVFRIVATAFLIFILCAPIVVASASAAPAFPASGDVPASGHTGPGITYRTIEERQDALGVHPVLLENPGAHDPTYSELVDFLRTDDTVQHEYDNPNFTCANFATELQNNAESQGLNGGYTSLGFCGKDSGHAVNVFDTVDQGPVYVDTTGGKVIVSKGLQPGEQYYNMGIISKVTEYW